MKRKALSFLLLSVVSTIMLGKVSDGVFLSKGNETAKESLGLATIEDLTSDADCSILVGPFFK